MPTRIIFTNTISFGGTIFNILLDLEERKLGRQIDSFSPLRLKCSVII